MPSTPVRLPSAPLCQTRVQLCPSLPGAGCVTHCRHGDPLRVPRLWATPAVRGAASRKPPSPGAPERGTARSHPASAVISTVVAPVVRRRCCGAGAGSHGPTHTRTGAWPSRWPDVPAPVTAEQLCSRTRFMDRLGCHRKRQHTVWVYRISGISDSHLGQHVGATRRRHGRCICRLRDHDAW